MQDPLYPFDDPFTNIILLLAGVGIFTLAFCVSELICGFIYSNLKHLNKWRRRLKHRSKAWR